MEKGKYQIKFKSISPKLLILIIAIAGVWGLIKIAQSPSEPLPGQAVEIQGKTHIAVGQSHPPYNSLPPTSGWHYANPAHWGIHDTPVADETQVHNLEHGGIMVQYRPGINKDALENLKRIVSSYASDVILAPYPNLDKNIALTAWGRIDKFDDFDEARIKRFINAFKDEGPEKISN